MQHSNSPDAERIHWIDLMRIVAIILVTLCHSVEEGIYDISLQTVSGMQEIDRIFPFVSFTLGRMGVPLFLLISGYLLLEREYDSATTVKFWKYNWMHLVGCSVIWFIIYDVFLFTRSIDISFPIVLMDALFLHEVKMSHVWYLPMIIGLYICIPYVSNAIKRVQQIQIILITLSFFFVTFFIYPTISVILRIVEPSFCDIKNQIGMGFGGGAYGVYLIVGGLLKRERWKLESFWLMIMMILGFLASIGVQLLAYEYGIGYNIWYDSPFLFIATISLFQLVSRLEIRRGNKVLRWMASYAFGVYLIHFPLKLSILDYVVSLPFRKEIQVIIMWSILTGLSFVLSVMIGKIPRVGNWLLYRK